MVSVYLLHVTYAAHLIQPRNLNAVDFPILQLDGLIGKVKKNPSSINFLLDIVKLPLAPSAVTNHVLSKIADVGLNNLPIPSAAATVISALKITKALTVPDTEALQACRALAEAFNQNPILPQSTSEDMKELYLLGSVPVFFFI